MILPLKSSLYNYIDSAGNSTEARCAEGGWSLGTYNYKCAIGRRSERGPGNGGGGWSGAFSHGGGE